MDWPAYSLISTDAQYAVMNPTGHHLNLSKASSGGCDLLAVPGRSLHSSFPSALPVRAIGLAFPSGTTIADQDWKAQYLLERRQDHLQREDRSTKLLPKEKDGLFWVEREDRGACTAPQCDAPDFTGQGSSTGLTKTTS